MSVAVLLPALEAMPRPVRRRVRTLGHALTRLRAGLQLLNQQTARGTLGFAFSAEWLNRWAGDRLATPLPLPVDSSKGLALTWEEEAWQVVAPLVNEASLNAVSAEWLVALLLLQLPALKGFWQRALRTQRFALLRQVLPRVWALDLTPLPPGATISGLGLGNWHDLPRLLAQGRRFDLVNLETSECIPLPSSTTAESWQIRLDQAKSGQWVLIEQPTAPTDGLMWATWATKDGWIDLNALQPQPRAAVMAN